MNKDYFAAMNEYEQALRKFQAAGGTLLKAMTHTSPEYIRKAAQHLSAETQRIQRHG